MTAQRDALARIVASRLLDLSLDEVRVLDRISARMLVGHSQYGRLDLAREQRDWGAEGSDELSDYLFYGACKEIAANDARIERLRCESADEIHGLIEPGLRELVAFEMPDVDGDA